MFGATGTTAGSLLTGTLVTTNLAGMSVNAWANKGGGSPTNNFDGITVKTITPTSTNLTFHNPYVPVQTPYMMLPMCGLDLGSQKIITKASIYGPQNGGYFQAWNGSTFLYPAGHLTVMLYGSNTNPTTDPIDPIHTLIGGLTFSVTGYTDESAGRSIISLDTVNKYRYVWMMCTNGLWTDPVTGGAQALIYYSQLQFYGY